MPFGACRSAPAPQTFHGGELLAPEAAPELGLADGQGHPFRLADQAGRVVLVTFGYTNCPDFCPGTLALYRQVKDSLPAADAARVRFVFVTSDPVRDTAPVLARYVGSFDPAFVGLTGEPAAVAAVVAGWGVQAEPDPSGAVTHSTSVYVVDRQGRLRLTHPFGSRADALTADVRALLAEEDKA